MANQLLDPPAIEWVAGELAADPDFEFLCLVDSLSGVKMLEEALAQSQLQRPLRVLVEMGVQGGRSGCREENAATSVAKAILEAPHLQLAGIEGYEGAIPARTVEERIAAIDTYLNAIRALASNWYRSGFFGGVDEVVITAGGSLFFDRVAEVFSHPREFPMRVMLRSGSYFAHDLDSQEQLSPLAERGKPPVRLRPALEFWGRVLSTPEPGLAIGGFGKRDAAYDLALPTPFALRRDGISRDIRGQVHVTALNDQHAFLRVAPDCDLRVGDVIGCHISHPCTSFDKWHLVPLVDDDYGVVGAIRCYF